MSNRRADTLPRARPTACTSPSPATPPTSSLLPLDGTGMLSVPFPSVHTTLPMLNCPSATSSRVATPRLICCRSTATLPSGLASGNMARHVAGVLPEGRARGREKVSTFATSHPATGDATHPGEHVPVHSAAEGPPSDTTAAESNGAHMWSAHAAWHGDWEGEGLTVGVCVSEGDVVVLGDVVGVSVGLSDTVGVTVLVTLEVGVRVCVAEAVALVVAVMEMVGVRVGDTEGVTLAVSEMVGVADADKDVLLVEDGEACTQKQSEGDGEAISGKSPHRHHTLTSHDAWLTKRRLKRQPHNRGHQS